LGFKIIWKACAEGDLDLVRNLHREGQDINEPTQFLKNTPLHISTFFGHMLIVKYLLEQGAEVNQANGEGKTAVDLTHHDEENKIFRLLLQAGAGRN
jgi:ankyrin repeat protein